MYSHPPPIPAGVTASLQATELLGAPNPLVALADERPDPSPFGYTRTVMIAVCKRLVCRREKNYDCNSSKIAHAPQLALPLS